MEGIKAQRLIRERKEVLLPFLEKKLPIYDAFLLSSPVDLPNAPIGNILLDPMV